MKVVGLPQDYVPGLEDLAAYLDGRLENAERQAVEKRLAEDEAFYETFVESVRFREEEGITSVNIQPAMASPLVVASAVPRRSRRWIPSLIAAVLVLVAVGVWPFSETSPGSLPASFDSLVAIEHSDWDYRSWSVDRSPGLPAHLSDVEVAFRLGTALVDLDVSLRAERRDDASIQASRLTEASERFGLLPSLTFRNLQSEIGGELTFEDGFDRARDGRREMLRGLEAEGERQALVIGEWCERARLAALTKDAKTLTKHLRKPPREVKGAESMKEPLADLRDLIPRLDSNDATVFEDATRLLTEAQGKLGG